MPKRKRCDFLLPGRNYLLGARNGQSFQKGGWQSDGSYSSPSYYHMNKQRIYGTGPYNAIVSPNSTFRKAYLLNVCENSCATELVTIAELRKMLTYMASYVMHCTWQNHNMAQWLMKYWCILNMEPLGDTRANCTCCKDAKNICSHSDRHQPHHFFQIVTFAIAAKRH